jgi:hypothetical protein
MTKVPPSPSLLSLSLHRIKIRLSWQSRSRRPSSRRVGSAPIAFAGRAPPLLCAAAPGPCRSSWPPPPPPQQAAYRPRRPQLQASRHPPSAAVSCPSCTMQAAAHHPQQHASTPSSAAHHPQLHASTPSSAAAGRHQASAAAGRGVLPRVRKTGGNRSSSVGSWWNRSGPVHKPVRFPPPNRA